MSPVPPSPTPFLVPSRPPDGVSPAARFALRRVLGSVQWPLPAAERRRVKANL